MTVAAGSQSKVSDALQHAPVKPAPDPSPTLPELVVGGLIPQFYHLWPALMATSYDVGGNGWLLNMTPFVALLSILAFVLLLRRAVPGRASIPAAVLGGLLLSTSMLEVWHAKYPTTES